jgi:hypothetical protein
LWRVFFKCSVGAHPAEVSQAFTMWRYRGVISSSN